MQEKNKKRKQRKTKSRKQGTKASKKENRSQGVSIATNLPVSATMLQSRDGDLATPSTIFLLLSATVSSVTAAAVEPPPPRTNQRKPNKSAWTRGLKQLRFHLFVEPVPCHTICHFICSMRPYIGGRHSYEGKYIIVQYSVNWAICAS